MRPLTNVLTPDGIRAIAQEYVDAIGETGVESGRLSQKVVEMALSKRLDEARKHCKRAAGQTWAQLCMKIQDEMQASGPRQIG